MTTKWKCSYCDQWHTDLPLAYGPLYPDYYLQIPEAEREERSQIDEEFCIIDCEHFFVRGRLEIPILDSEETFAWVVWVSLSETNFGRTIELLEKDGRESEPPYFGWLSTHLSIYTTETRSLRTHVHTRVVGLLPTIEVESIDHPLSLDQRNGITLDRVREIASLLLHEDTNREH